MMRHKRALRGRHGLDGHSLRLLLDLEGELAVEVLDGMLVVSDRLEVRHILQCTAACFALQTDTVLGSAALI